MSRKSKPKFREGQVLAVLPTPKYPHPKPRYIFVDGVHELHGKFFYQDATLTATVGWSEDVLRCLTKQEAGR